MVKLSDKKYLTIGEMAELIYCSASQIRKWEKAGLMPEPAIRKKVGQRLDRRYTQEQVPKMKALRDKYSVGAPTADEQAERERIRQQLREEAGDQTP